jgi:SPP1 gp7 family putative phage head morphogenesis protein
MIGDYIGKINQQAEQAILSGWSPAQLAKEIQKIDGQMKVGRANLIARDQIGKLNGQVTQARMEAAGLDMYIWSTSGDERVRSSHAELDGKLCRWDDALVYSKDGGKTWIKRPGGMTHVHPGEDISCRCCALSYWDELVGEVDSLIDKEAWEREHPGEVYKKPAEQKKLTPLSEEEMNELGDGSIRNFKTETLDMDEAIEKAELMLKRLEITDGKKDEKEMAEYVLNDMIKGAKIKKELYAKGYIVSDKGNIFITNASSSEEIIKQVKPTEGFSWGNATEANKFAKAFSIVNSDSYTPYNPRKYRLEYSIKATVEENDVIRAISSRLDAQNRIKNSIISRNEMPYFLRGESMTKRQFDEMIKSGYRDLTGITALTANEKHNYSWLQRLSSGDPETIVRFHYLRDDNLEKKVGMVNVNDINIGGSDRQPDEVDIGGSRVKIERYEESSLEETGRGEALKIYDVFVRVID